MNFRPAVPADKGSSGIFYRTEWIVQEHYVTWYHAVRITCGKKIIRSHK